VALLLVAWPAERALQRIDRLLFALLALKGLNGSRLTSSGAADGLHCGY
jgi:hypothetical protein